MFKEHTLEIYSVALLHVLRIACHFPRASSHKLGWSGWPVFVKFSMCSYDERAGSVTEISVFPAGISVSRLENFAMWALQPGHRNESAI